MQRDLSLYFDIPSLRRFFLFISLVLFISTSYAADDIGRLRYFILSGDQGKITHGTNVSEDSIKTQGASIHLVFANGMGFGPAMMTTKTTLNSQSHTLYSENIDVSYTIGGEWSFTLGYGRAMNGRGEIKNGDEYVTSSVKGDALFMLFGMPFVFGELVGGLRWSRHEFGPYQKTENGTETQLEENIINQTLQMMLGYGLHF